MSHELQVSLSDRRFLESPRWHDGRIWVTDIYAQEILSAASDGTDVRLEAELAGLPSGTGFLPDGRLLIAMMQEHRILRREPSGEIAVHAELPVDHGNLNDMVVDVEGHAYVGAVGFDPMAGSASIRTGFLDRVDPDGTVTTVADGLLFPNGMVITDRRGLGLIVAESFGNRLTAYDIDRNGGLGGRREFARFGAPPASYEIPEFLPSLNVTPDGCCLDAEAAHLWVADPEHRCAIRVTEGGGIVDAIETDLKVFACMLGGADGRTLFLCSAPDSHPSGRRAAREGELRYTTVAVPGAGRP